jgi:hypothetical protein
VVHITQTNGQIYDFTLQKYRELCNLLKSQYEILTVRDYLKKQPLKSFVILRHDVDRRIFNAVRMAKLEHDLGIHSTYYFRYPYTFNPHTIKQIQLLGHEIGYHYEVLSKAQGNYEKAIVLYQSELEEFRKICPVDTICAHGSPLSKFDNRDLWNNHDFREFGIMGEGLLSIRDVQYFTDTGRCWNGDNNIRDKSVFFIVALEMTTTDEIMSYMRSKMPDKLYIGIHPERWAINQSDRFRGIARDYLINAGKKMITLRRKYL